MSPARLGRAAEGLASRLKAAVAPDPKASPTGRRASSEQPVRDQLTILSGTGQNIVGLVVFVVATSPRTS